MRVSSKKLNHRPPHHYANNCHRDRISKIPRQVAQPIQAFGRQRRGEIKFESILPVGTGSAQ